MDERADRARRRFDGLLSDGRAILRDVSPGPYINRQSATSLLAAAKAMHRAGGFLEATMIAFPELGRDLIVEFESFALELESVYGLPVGDWVRRGTDDRRVDPQRRETDQRSGGDRRAIDLHVLIERRTGLERRMMADRRVGPRRVVPERRYGSGAGISTAS